MIGQRVVIILNLSVHLYGLISLQCKNKLSKIIFCRFLKFFLLLHLMHHPSVMPFIARKKLGSMAQNMFLGERLFEGEP